MQQAHEVKLAEIQADKEKALATVSADNAALKPTVDELVKLVSNLATPERLQAVQRLTGRTPIVPDRM
jgi:hypothetical protein